MAPEPERIEPDTKDWTWTLERTCPDCGFTAADVAGPDVARRALELLAPWPQVLSRPDAAQRPEPHTWSPVEYGCHVRDVCRVFRVRVASMLDQDAPVFANWDQDESAVAGRYHEQPPQDVADEIAREGGAVAAEFDRVAPDQWGRTGLRNDGAQFTVETLGRYFLHDLAHHLIDVRA